MTTEASMTETFDASASSVRVARRFVERHLEEHGRHDAVPDALLVVSELATNAVEHGGTPFDVMVEVRDHSVVLEVTDGSAVLPTRRDAATDEERGRGLQLVAALAADCGVRGSARGGKSVWAALDTVAVRRAAGGGFPPG